MKEIYFLSIERALQDIGEAIELEMSPNTPPRPEFATIWRCSQAAANLHQVLHNVRVGRPQWMVIHPSTRRPVATDGAEAEGLLILEELSGWFSRYWHTYHFFAQRRDDPDFERELSRSRLQSMFKTRKPGCEDQIGFDRDQLIDYLDSPEVDMRHCIHLPIMALLARDERRLKRTGEREHPVDTPSPKPTSEAAPVAPREVPRLTLPTNADAWSKAIEATYDAIALEAGNTPKSHEVWLRMQHKPPDNYPVTITKDRGLPAIALPGERPLTRDGFNKRWRRYTNAIKSQARTTSDNSG